mmetsp:Transcript_75966/g.180683  ORF Transcript_75966/g.180683 Transcript_75966/m.180683 type:complete len:209 (+) Transcript_75966:2187-2813(+)
MMDCPSLDDRVTIFDHEVTLQRHTIRAIVHLCLPLCLLLFGNLGIILPIVLVVTKSVLPVPKCHPCLGALIHGSSQKVFPCRSRRWLGLGWVLTSQERILVKHRPRLVEPGLVYTLSGVGSRRWRRSRRIALRWGWLAVARWRWLATIVARRRLLLRLHRWISWMGLLRRLLAEHFTLTLWHQKHSACLEQAGANCSLPGDAPVDFGH